MTSRRVSRIVIDIVFTNRCVRVSAIEDLTNRVEIFQFGQFARCDTVDQSNPRNNACILRFRLEEHHRNVLKFLAGVRVFPAAADC